ncbi:MAG: bifunctional PIG-L family deacetylase/class I SAM-dependent methyltransferase [Nocardioides sp.]|uniref:bifunctional PIG-L family deacetylase/class I SAM-dependent methyltransferase n=1 Tax=Nocardioides sp. TaxID=35761 RepID=UPI0032665AC2
MTGPDFRHDEAGTPASAWTSALAAHEVHELDLPTTPGRLVVVGAHPDDETLGAGGLIRTAAVAGWQVEVVCATAGEGSHPSSPTHPPSLLEGVRRQELGQAIARLAPGAGVSCLGLPDGSLADHVEEVVAALVATIGTDGADVVLCAPWRGDGHPDHEAAGLAAAVAAARTDARLLEYPVWMWHWGSEADVPWRHTRLLPLDDTIRSVKRAAVAAHASQVEPLSSAPGDEVLLDDSFLAHFRRDVELFLEDDEPVSDEALELVHRERSDPWLVDSDYERRKRAISLASLPRDRYEQALEVGCSVGALAVDLAQRCGRLLAIDNSVTAIAAAAERTATLDHVEVRRAAVPDEWPSGSFDLVSVSEVGYFLSPRQLAAVVELSLGSLTGTGHLLLCHWRHQPVGWPLAGPAVHEAFLATGAPIVAEHHDPDFVLHVLGRPA